VSLPPRFEPNLGQEAGGVRFVARTAWGRALLAPDGLTVPGAAGFRFAGASRTAAMEGTGRLPGRSHFLHGRDAARRVRGVPHFAGARVRGAWPGIDVVWRGAGADLEFDLVVAPGADAGRAALAFDGARAVSIEPDGSLRAAFPTGDLLLGRPDLYQETAMGRRPVEGRYAARADGTVGFAVGSHDGRLPLVIDPTVKFAASFLGTGPDTVQDVALGPAGRIHLAGYAYAASTGRATPGAAQETQEGLEDAFLLVLSADGSTVLHATYLGGSGRDLASGVAVDADGASYLCGSTTSTDFPVASPIKATLGAGAFDAFVAKVSPDGSDLVYSTYLGGNEHSDLANGIALDGGRAVVVGQTSSDDFPMKDPIQSDRGGTTTLADAFVSILAADGASLTFSTFLGGISSDVANAVAVDASGFLYVAGNAGGGDFPTASAFQTFWGGGGDAFVTKLFPGGAGVVWSTYLGGSGSDEAVAIAVDPLGAATVTGRTFSPNFPTAFPVQAQRAVQPPGYADGYVARFAAEGNALDFSTYVGGTRQDWPVAVAVDGTRAPTVVLLTESTDLPTPGAFQPAFGGGTKDGYVLRLDPAGRARTYATYLGGTTDEYPTSLAMTPSGAPIVAGNGGSADFPWTSGKGGAFAVQLVAPPVALSGSLVGYDAARLDWVDDFGGGDSYRLERRTGGGPWETAGISIGAARTFLDQGLPEVATYVYRLFRVTNGEDSLPSNEVSVTTLLPPPPAPTGFQATLEPGLEVHLSWDASPGAASYEVLRSCDGGATWVLLAVVTGTAYTDVIPPDRACIYRIRARNASGTSAESGPAAVASAPSLLVSLRRGLLRYRPGEGRDSLRALLLFRLVEEASPDGTLDPVADGLVLRFGSWEEEPVLSIPPGDAGWRRAGRRLAWRSPAGADPRVAISLDLRRGKLVVEGTRLDLGAPRSNPIRVLVSVGDDAGSAIGEWRVVNPLFPF
jgi:hypothetical protein